MKGFRPQDVRLYRPYPDDIPYDLLEEADADLAGELSSADADRVRVAKYDGAVVGAYVVLAGSPLRWELCCLVVAEGFRRLGLGRWLLGHAIGLAETKGGREVLVRNVAGATPAGRLLEDTGFVACPEGWLLQLTPE